MKQLFQIAPGSDKESIQPVLSIRMGERHCCFAIADHASQELNQLAYYTADVVNENFLDELFAAHPELNGTFYQVLVCYDHPQSSLVPLKYYHYEEAGLLLETLYGVNSTATIISELVTDWQLYNIYAVPKGVHGWVGKRFVTGRCRYWHQYTLNTRNSKAAGTGGHLLVDFRKEDFTLLATGNNQLLLEQTFLYTNPDDVIYYLLMICRQFGLSQRELHLELSGLIDKRSALYNELYQYFINVEFRETGWNNANHEYPAHFFTSLNDLAQCAS